MTDAVAIVGGRVVTGLGEEIESGTVLLSDGASRPSAQGSPCPRAPG